MCHPEEPRAILGEMKEGPLWLLDYTYVSSNRKNSWLVNRAWRMMLLTMRLGRSKRS